MTSKKTLPGKVKRAASSFRPKRAEYYGYLSDMLKASKGETKMLTLFERDAERYTNNPRGVLSAYWAETYGNNGGDLADALEGTLPDDEVSILRVAQTAGGGAIELALGDVARVARVADKSKSEVLSIMMVALVGMTVALVMTTIYPIFASGKLKEIFSFIPVEVWGTKATGFLNHAERVKSYGLYWLAAFICVVTWIQWSIDNWVGPAREWADQHIILYRSIRDLKGAMFLATMATLTRRRGNVMHTLHESLLQYSQSLRSKWMRWRVEEIVERVEATGGTSSDAFDTNLMSKEMYYFLRDVQEARGFADGFEEAGLQVENVMLNNLVKRMTMFRWVILGGSVLMALGVLGWQFAVINEMKGTMAMYMSSK